MVRSGLGEEAEQGHTQPPGAAPLAAQTVLGTGSGPALAWAAGAANQLACPHSQKLAAWQGAQGREPGAGSSGSWQQNRDLGARSPASLKARRRRHSIRPWPCSGALGLLTSSTGGGRWAVGGGQCTVGGTRVPGALLRCEPEQKRGWQPKAEILSHDEYSR